MDKNDVKRIVYGLLKEDYYKKLRALESDINFFSMYMERNKKSDFRFDLRISHEGSFKAFDVIWRKYGYHKDEIETAFSEYMLLRLIICDVYDETNIFTADEILTFIMYFERYEDTLVNDYVGDFIGCSHACHSVMDKINKMKSCKTER